MRCGIGFGELHHYRSDRRIEIDGVVVAGKLAVKIKRSTGARRGDNGDCRPLLLFYRGASGQIGIAAAFRSEAGQSDDGSGAAAANIHAGHGGRSGGSVAGAAGTGRGRDSAPHIGLGARAGSSLARA